MWFFDLALRAGIFLVLISEWAVAAGPVAAPRRDPPGQPFRIAPMPMAARSVVIPLATNRHLAFDMELLRTHTVWAGPGLNLYGPPYHGGKTPFLSTFDGERVWGSPPFSPWATRLPDEKGMDDWAELQFNEIDTKEGRVSLHYEMRDRDGGKVGVRERPWLIEAAGVEGVGREIEVGPSEREIWFRAHAEMVSGSGSLVGAAGGWLRRSNDVLVVVVVGMELESVRVLERQADYAVPIHIEKADGESDVRLEPVTGRQGEIWIQVKARPEPVQFEVRSSVAGSTNEVGAVAKALSRAEGIGARAEGGQERPRKAEVIGGGRASSPGGDSFYRIEHFPIPREVRLMVTGMDWLENGDLAVCTWPGEIYIVENAQGPLEGVKYRRFAAGLNEPLGVKTVGYSLYLVQKTGLTRVTDSDRNGEADRFEVVNDDWGYTGNYHAFAFGPVMDRTQNMYAFICGQRGRWEMPYVGWCVRIDAAGELTPFCSGLRAPNGVGTYGPNDDLFMTENQGNWIGACKLNHLQAGRFYGFPSGKPAPREQYGRAAKFEAPAVWFPRKLSPSSSGFTTISDERFGPFQGQMVVGDFQNATLMRVYLERVEGEWQGAVWPFAKGFFSGVNRVVMGADGRLYVGGLKNSAWPASAPFEMSLDRVSFTGKRPFAVREVQARPDGFELRFTEAIDRASAGATDNYFVAQHTYKYHAIYGSPEMDHEGKENSATEIGVTRAVVSEDGRAVRLVLANLRAGYVTMISMPDVTSAGGEALWQDPLYYTLNRIPLK